MLEAILPFIGYCVLQLFAGVVGLNVIRIKRIGITSVIKTWIFGQMLVFTVLQIMAVPMILLRCKFDVLFWSYVDICVVLFGFGCWRLLRGNTRRRIRKPKLSPLALALIIVAACLILWQAGNYFFRMHLDEDDARWLAEANDAIEYGDMMIRDVNTGELLSGVFTWIKDVTSPWPLMYAVASRILHTNTAVFAHTIYGPIELLLMYGTYWLISCELTKKTETRIAFLVFVAIINLFQGGTPYSQSAFSLVRIWQGKASIAAVIIPLLLYCFICLNKRHEASDWIKVFITGCAGTLMSGMGVALSAIMVGIYGAYYIIAYQEWKHIPLYLLALLPPVSIALLHFTLKG